MKEAHLGQVFLRGTFKVHLEDTTPIIGRYAYELPPLTQEEIYFHLIDLTDEGEPRLETASRASNCWNRWSATMWRLLIQHHKLELDKYGEQMASLTKIPYWRSGSMDYRVPFDKDSDFTDQISELFERMLPNLDNKAELQAQIARGRGYYQPDLITHIEPPSIKQTIPTRTYEETILHAEETILQANAEETILQAMNPPHEIPEVQVQGQKYDNGFTGTVQQQCSPPATPIINTPKVTINNIHSATRGVMPQVEEENNLSPQANAQALSQSKVTVNVLSNTAYGTKLPSHA
jgi:hypothetical protein